MRRGQVGVDLALEAPMAAVRAKSLALGELLIRLIRERCPGDHGLRLVSPADPVERGSQLCFSHPEAYGIVQAGGPARMFACTALDVNAFLRVPLFSRRSSTLPGISAQFFKPMPRRDISAHASGACRVA